MSPPLGRRLQVAAVCVAFVIYLGLSHYCNTVSHDRNLGALLALAPELMVGAALAWRWTSPAAAVVLTGLAGALLHQFWGLFAVNYARIYLVQDVGLDVFLGLTFARSLGGGHVALCTELADKVHGPLTTAEIHYTRQVTAAWAVFFSSMAVASLVLFFLTPLRIWSFFVNVCAFPLIGLMFVAENGIRRRVLPKGDRPGILATMRVYLANPQ